MTDLAAELAFEFETRQYKWKKHDGAMAIPTKQDIQDALDTCKKALDNKDNWTQVVLGRMIVVKNAKHFDVFLHVGEIE